MEYSVAPVGDRSVAFLAYLAGILDGEGTIVLGKKEGKNGKPRYQLQVSIFQKEPDWLLLLAKRWGDIGYQYKHTNPSRNGNWIASWSLYSGRAKALLVALLPYLTLKRHQAEGAIEFQTNMENKGYSQVPFGWFEYGEWVKQNISRYNQREFSWGGSTG